MCLIIILCAFVVLTNSTLRTNEKNKLEQNADHDSDQESQEMPYKMRERELSGTCVKTYQETSSCMNCLNSSSINSTLSKQMGWCADPQFCFDASDSTNVNACNDKCKGDIYYSNDPNYKSECSQTTLSITSVILIFIIVVVCPVCLVGSCVALLCYRCHNAMNNKVAIGRDNDLVNTVAPIPVLSVYNGYSNSPVSFPMTAVATIAEPPVINVDEINGFKTSGVAIGASNNNNVGASSSGRNTGIYVRNGNPNSQQYTAFAVSSGDTNY